MSEPSESGTSPPATAPPEPLDEPPVMRDVSCGLHALPSCDVLAGEVVGVFAHVERADQDRAGGLEPLDQRLVMHGGRKLAVDLRARARRQALYVEQVFHREWHARERPERFARRARLVDRARLLFSALGRHVGE